MEGQQAEIWRRKNLSFRRWQNSHGHRRILLLRRCRFRVQTVAANFSVVTVKSLPERNLFIVRILPNPSADFESARIQWPDWGGTGKWFVLHAYIAHDFGTRFTSPILNSVETRIYSQIVFWGFPWPAPYQSERARIKRGLGLGTGGPSRNRQFAAPSAKGLNLIVGIPPKCS